MILFTLGFLDRITKGIGNTEISFPVVIGIVLSIAFVSMLLVTIFTLISIKRSDLKSKRIIDIPPSALKIETNDTKIPETDVDKSTPFPFGEWINSYLINKGYIKSSGLVRSFFKSLSFLKNSLGRNYKYKLPWYLILGAEESGKTSLMNGFTHDEIYDGDDDSPCTWWFLKNGVVLDIKGDIFLPKVGFDADEKNWNVLLNLLSRYRSEKPINGIILTIPANELYGKNKLSNEDIKKRALYISRKLNFAQNYLGMKLPVYIVITKTDVVPGFQSFCSEIPARNRMNMLGWSCPYSLSFNYNPKMLDDGFNIFENNLNDLRIEIISEGSAKATMDGIFVFPSELLTIKESLKLYIDAIFRFSSVEEKFYFRGFYFTGDSKMMPLLSFDNNSRSDAMAIVGTPDADVNEAGKFSAFYSDEDKAAKKIFFFEDLLLKKIFPEEGIASPMKSKIYQSNKSIMLAKISTAAFVLIGSYGLFNARDSLSINKNNLYPSLFKVSSLIKNAGDMTYKNLQNNGNEILADCTSQLLSIMQQIHNIRLSSLFVPASWFSPINKDLTETLRTSYQKVVVRTIYMNLILKSRELLGMIPEHKSNGIDELLNPYNSYEYGQLKDYVFGLIELEKNIKKFDSLRVSGDPKDLNDLVDYTFKGSLPNEFLDNYQEFRSILMNVPFPAINLSPYKQRAYDTLLSLFQNYLDTIFTVRSKNSLVYQLNKFINQLSRQNLKEVPNCSEIIEFSKKLTKVCKDLGKEGETWLDKDIFESDKEYDEFLDGIETLFGKEVSQRLLDITAINFGYLKSQLMNFNLLLNRDVAKKTNQKKEESVSSGIFKIEKCLSSLCSEPFMETPGDYQLITDIPEGKMIFWDDELVKYANEVGKSYEQFITTNLKDFPKSMQEGVSLLSKSNLCALIAGIIAKSQSLVDEPTGITEEITSEELLQKQVAELKGVAPKIVNLLKILRDDKFSFVFGNLRAILNKIGFSLLTHIDNLLENQKPYQPNDLSFSYWDGKNGAGLTAFSSSDMEELRLYLQLQRNMILRLAKDFAEPIVEFLNVDVMYDKNYSNNSQLVKWSRIVDDVKGLEKKNPLNSVSLLEKFVTITLNDYTLDNITQKINLKDIKGESGDYFLNIIKKIKKGILSKAEVLLRKRNIARYNSLRDYYTKHLENVYPFKNYDKSKRTTNDADLDAVREFFKMYDEFGGTPEAVLDQIYQLEGDTKKVYEFMKNIHDLKLFLGERISFNESIKVNLEFDFGINKREEKNTEYLVDRICKPNNDSSIESISPDKSGLWYFGEPIEINLRWASGDDQADKPVYDQNDPDLILDNNTVKIQCVGNWALLRFLQKYKSQSVNVDNLSKNQIVLRFKVPLNTGKIARLFIGVTPSLPKKPGDPSIVTLKVPSVPGPMPELPNSVKSVSEIPVLVSRNSFYESSEELDSSNEISNIVEDKKISNTKSNVAIKNVKNLKTAKGIEKKTAKQSEKEVMNILESNEVPEINEENQVIEISEEPIG